MLTGSLAFAAIAAQARQTIFQKTPAGGLVSVEQAPGGRFALCFTFRLPKSAEPWQGHLAEHLLISGKDGTLAARLQAYDISAQGFTTRNQVSIVLEGPSPSVMAATIAMAEMFEIGAVPPATATHELAVLLQEKALRPSYQKDLVEIWEATAHRGSIDPTDTPVAPEGTPKALLSQVGSAFSVVADGDPKPIAEALLKLELTLPAGPQEWPDPEIGQSGSSEGAAGVRVGPIGTPTNLSGAAVTYAVGGYLSGLSVFDIDSGPSYAFVIGDKSALKSTVRQETLDRAPTYARQLVDNWTSDPILWVRVKASSLLAGERIKKSELADLPTALRPEDYAAAFDRLVGK